MTIGILLFGVFGALVATNEYGSGLIRTTLAATPQRGLVLAAKAVLAGLVPFALAVVITFTVFFTGQAYSPVLMRRTSRSAITTCSPTCWARSTT